MGIKELNEKCRTSSYTLLNTIAEKFIDKEAEFEEYINILVAGLGGVPIYCSASLLALTSITYHYNGKFTTASFEKVPYKVLNNNDPSTLGSLGIPTLQKILGIACSLAIGPTREITLSALSFIKVYLSAIPTPTVAPTLNTIVSSIV